MKSISIQKGAQVPDIEKHYEVEVQRISYSKFRTIHVLAKTAIQATVRAYDLAGDFEYSEDVAEYDIVGVKEVSLP